MRDVDVGEQVGVAMVLGGASALVDRLAAHLVGRVPEIAIDAAKSNASNVRTVQAGGNSKVRFQSDRDDSESRCRWARVRLGASVEENCSVPRVRCSC